MTKKTADLAPKAIRAAIAVVLLVVVVVVVVSYYGGYKSAKSGAGEATETTASADATASGEATSSPEGGEGESSEEQASNGTVVVLIDGLNFRTEPSKGGDLIKGLDEGTKLAYIETTEGWYKVRTSDGKVGYVSASAQYTELKK